MRQFFEAYRGDKKVSPLVRQLPWTHHLIILGQSKRPEEREFYLRLAVRERWSKRELERQLTGRRVRARGAQSGKSVTGGDTNRIPRRPSVFKDAYLVEFLDLPRRPLRGRPARGPGRTV